MKLDLKDQIVRSMIGQILGALFRFIFSASVAAAIWIISGNVWPFLKDAGIPIGISIAIGISLIISFFRERKGKFRCRYPSYDFRFKILEKEMSYRRGADGRLTFHRRLKVKALKSGLDDFVDRYLWTGSKASLPQGVRNVAGIEPIERNAGIWNFFSVKFPRVLNRGEEIEFELVQTVDDQEMLSRPFFSTSVEEPTYKLILDLDLPDSLGVTECVCEVLRGIESIYPFSTESHTLDRGRHKWEISNPRLYHHYRLYWKWPSKNEISTTAQEVKSQVSALGDKDGN